MGMDQMKVTLFVAAASVAIMLPAAAHADDDSYLSNLASHGIITFKNPGGLLAAGHGICNDLRSGVSVPDEIGRWSAQNYLATPQGAATMVNAAHDELCP
jgi:hypothetical protein